MKVYISGVNHDLEGFEMGHALRASTVNKDVSVLVKLDGTGGFAELAA
jgi:hypothetical protein